MADENKESVKNIVSAVSKKKKIIIGAVAAVIVCAVVVVACVYAFGGDKNEYKDTLVTGEASSDLKPGVENGEFIENYSNPDQESTSSADNQDSGSASGSGETVSEDSDGGENAGGSGSTANFGNSGFAGNSGSSGSSETTEGQTEAEATESSTEQETEQNTEPVSRQIEVYITLPNDGNVADKLFIRVNGVNLTPDGEDASLNGSTFHFITEDSYEGVVAVEAWLQNYGTSEKQYSSTNGSVVRFGLPLNGVEENYAPDI